MSYKVRDEYRTNVLSKVPGGTTVIVEKSNGQVLEYTNIKNPEAYIKRIKQGPGIIRVYVK